MQEKQRKANSGDRECRTADRTRLLTNPSAISIPSKASSPASKTSQTLFIHSSDIHIGSPFLSCSSLQERHYNALKSAPYTALRRLINKAIDLEAKFILIAGDIFDCGNISLSSKTLFLQEIERLDANGISCLIVFGNHDPEGDNRENFISSLPSNCYVFGHNEPETVEPYKGVKVIGISYKGREEFRDLAKEISKTAISSQSKGTKDFLIGLLHTNCDGLGGNKNYARTTLAFLKDTPIDYWAIGHVHKHIILNESEPLIAYSGMPQGRDFQETGPRGALMAAINGDNRLDSVKFFITSPVIWLDFDINIGARDKEGLSEENIRDIVIKEIKRVSLSYKKPEITHIMLRLNLKGQSRLKRINYIEDFLFDLRESLNYMLSSLSPICYLIEIIDNTYIPIDHEEILKRDDIIGTIYRVAEGLLKDGKDRKDLFNALEPILKRKETSYIIKELIDNEGDTLIKEAREFLFELLE